MKRLQVLAKNDPGIFFFFFSETKVWFIIKLYLLSNRKDGGNMPLRANGLNYFPRVPHVLQSRS